MGMLNVVSLTLSVAALALSFFIAQLLIESLDERTVRHTAAETKPESTAKENNVYTSKGSNAKPAKGSKIEKLVKEKLLSTPSKVVDEMCSEMDSACFQIIDRVRDEGNRILAFRKVRRKGPQGVLTLSETRIQPPSPLTWENFNTKTWKIRKDTVRLIYARMMIVGTFMSGALEFNTKRKQDVLIIGLGGGIINNYLTTMKNQKLNVTVVELDPVMKKIAEKWFGFQESPLHRIVIDDGVDYLHEAAKRGEKYDVILIDVSYNTHRRLMGPTEDFLKDDVIKSMRAVTADTGATIVNIVTTKEAKEEAQKVYFVYSRHFPSCYLLNHSQNDKMLFCSAKEKNSWYDIRDELYKRYVAVDKALGFQLSLEDQCSTYPLD